MKRELPFIVLFIFSFIVLLSYFLPNLGFGSYTLGTASTSINSWVLMVTAWMEGVAAINIFMHNAKKGIREKKKAPECFLLCIGLVVATTLVVIQRYSADARGVQAFYQNLYDYFVQSAGNAIYALLAFYVASASYRAFRARSVESTCMLAAAVLVMIGASPLGEAIWPGFSTIKNWLIDIPNVAGTRALLICASIGAIATSMKVLLGIERTAIGE